MIDLVVLVPSRGRPEAIDELRTAFELTCHSNTELWPIIDADDPRVDDYADGCLVRDPARDRTTSTPNTMVAALNWGFGLLADRGPAAAFAVGFMGDDHRPRTPGWDAAYLQALRELGTGIVYGNDLLQKAKLPTQCAMTMDIPYRLGKMAPRGLRHLYVDNWWRDLGAATGCIQYLPDVVVEHMHPVARKAKWDDGYNRVNGFEVSTADAAAYKNYRTSILPHDIEAVQELMRK